MGNTVQSCYSLWIGVSWEICPKCWFLIMTAFSPIPSRCTGNRGRRSSGPMASSCTWEEYGRIGRGVSDIQMFASLVKNAPRLPVDELMLLNLERRRMVLEWSLAKSPIPQQTIEMLATLKRYRIGLVTSSDRVDVEPVLRRLRNL